MSNALKQLNHPVVSIIHTILRLFLGGMFLWSGVEKLNQLDLFYKTAQNYKVLTPFLTQLYATLLPWLEVGGGLYLLLGLFTRWAGWLSNAMLLSFLIALVMVLQRGDAVDCGCFFGGEIEPVTWDLVYRDLGLLAASLVVTFTPFSKLSVDYWLEMRKSKAES